MKEVKNLEKKQVLIDNPCLWELYMGNFTRIISVIYLLFYVAQLSSLDLYFLAIEKFETRFIFFLTMTFLNLVFYIVTIFLTSWFYLKILDLKPKDDVNGEYLIIGE